MLLFKRYFEHINLYPNSLIARIHGVYQVTLGDQNPVYLVLMGNTKQAQNQFIKFEFDLKGSMVSREVHGIQIPTYTLKDKNVLNLKKKRLGATRQADPPSAQEQEETKGMARVGTAGGTRDQPLECPFRECGRKFVSDPELKNHMSRRHKPAEPIAEDEEKKGSAVETTSSSR